MRLGIVLLLIWMASAPVAAAGAPFDIEVVVGTGLGEQIDREIAALIESEVSDLVYLTAAQKKAAVDDPPRHRLRIVYEGEVRTSGIIEKPASRPETPPARSIEYATRGKLECALLLREGDALEPLDTWGGEFMDQETLKLGRSNQAFDHIMNMARQAVIARVVLELSRVVKASFIERFWPTRLINVAPDKDGTVTGTYIVTNASPWTLDFTVEVKGEVVNPEKLKKTSWYYLHKYEKRAYKKERLAPGATIERGFELGLEKATPTQIASGRIYETEYADFAFRADFKRVAWVTKQEEGNEGKREGGNEERHEE